ncbi:hypothetical protein K1T71_002502 [Dendrolimus kikuchii]|uniref:Uncharacterized protein n=1 Tax=Dendrolimus kikuchii TaxID=765133 RepID=A0ACC1DD91_9NEOP|nr:hypothetical protein K1T71_002502 [Dendrolimus kikuchii]
MLVSISRVDRYLYGVGDIGWHGKGAGTRLRRRRTATAYGRGAVGGGRGRGRRGSRTRARARSTLAPPPPTGAQPAPTAPCTGNLVLAMIVFINLIKHEFMVLNDEFTRASFK